MGGVNLKLEDYESMHYDREKFWDTNNNSIPRINRAKISVDLIPNDVVSILDIGCGDGMITNMINKPLVIGIDFVRFPLTKVKKDAIQGLIDFLPIKSKKIDLIIVTEVFEHLNKKIFSKAIDEIKLLDPKYLLISTPYEQFLDAGYCKCANCGNIFHVAHHYNSFEKDWYHEIFPEYKVESIKLIGKTNSPCISLVHLKHKYGIWYYSKISTCNKCGNIPVKPTGIHSLLINDFTIIIDSIVKKRILKIYKPTHQILLLRKNIDFTDE
jgi:SAM-dependent methyltransferase